MPSSLHTLILYHNDIETVSVDYFNRSQGLKYLDISRNSLHEITFGQVDSLMEIRLSHNNLNAMPSTHPTTAFLDKNGFE